MSSRDEFAETMKRQIDEWNNAIERLESQAKEADQSARAQYEEAVNVMRRNVDEAQKGLGKLQNTSSDAWRDVQKGYEDAWSNLTNAMQSAMNRWR